MGFLGFFGCYLPGVSLGDAILLRKSLRSSSGMGPLACAVLTGDVALLSTLVEKRASLCCAAPLPGKRFAKDLTRTVYRIHGIFAYLHVYMTFIVNVGKFTIDPKMN